MFTLCDAAYILRHILFILYARGELWERNIGIGEINDFNIAAVIRQGDPFPVTTVTNSSVRCTLPCCCSVPYRARDYSASHRRSSPGLPFGFPASPGPLIERQWYWSRRAWILLSQRYASPEENSDQSWHKFLLSITYFRKSWNFILTIPHIPSCGVYIYIYIL